MPKWIENKDTRRHVAETPRTRKVTKSWRPTSMLMSYHLESDRHCCIKSNNLKIESVAFHKSTVCNHNITSHTQGSGHCGKDRRKEASPPSSIVRLERQEVTQFWGLWLMADSLTNTDPQEASEHKKKMCAWTQAQHRGYKGLTMLIPIWPPWCPKEALRISCQTKILILSGNGAFCRGQSQDSVSD